MTTTLRRRSSPGSPEPAQGDGSGSRLKQAPALPAPSCEEDRPWPAGSPLRSAWSHALLFLLALFLPSRLLWAGERPTPEPDGRDALLTLSSERLEQLKKGGQWRFELWAGGRAVASALLELRHDSQKRQLVFQETLQGAWNQRTRMVFEAARALTLAGFESVFPPQDPRGPRRARGELRGGQLEGTDGDGDRYTLPQTHDFLPRSGLALLALACDPASKQAFSCRTLDEEVGDLLEERRFAALPEGETLRLGKAEVVCRRYACKEDCFWVDPGGRLAKARTVLAGRRVEWRLREPAADGAPVPFSNCLSPEALAEVLANPPVPGLMISTVLPGSAADEAGLMVGDILTRCGEVPVVDLASLRKGFQQGGPAGKTELVLNRRGEPLRASLAPARIGISVVPAEPGKPVTLSKAAGAPPPRSPALNTELERLAHQKCGSRIAWSRDLAAARLAAEAARRPVLCWIDSTDTSPGYCSQIMQAYLRSALFTDPELVQYLERHYSLCQAAVHRADQERLGLPPLTTPALLFLRPDGSLLHCVDGMTTFSREFLADLLRKVWRKAELPAPPAPASLLPAALRNAEALLADFEAQAALVEAERLLREGQLEGEARAQAGHLRAQALRWLCRKEEALAALEQARALSRDPALLGALRTEEALVLLKARQAAAALKALARTVEPEAAAGRSAEAAYLKGAALRLSGDDAGARNQWTAAGTAFREDPYGWLSAAEALGIGPLGRGFYALQWLQTGALEGLRGGTVHPAAAAERGAAVQEAVRLLLELQSADGGWNDTNYDFGNELGNNPPGVDSMPNVRMAVTAICAEALLRWRAVDPQPIDAALERSWGYLCNKQKISWLDQNELVFAHFFRLNLFCAWQALAGERRKAELAEAIQGVVTELKKGQDRQGLWRHEYPNGFVTGSALLSLSLARGAGATIDSGMVERGVQVLLGTREERGTWPYMPRPDSGPRAWKGSMGRAVNAEAALSAWSKGSPGALVRALNQYLHWNFVQERVRKHTYHSDAYATGGFFYFYNVLGFAQALRLVPPEAARRPAEALRASILSIREIDGSYVDSFQLGKGYATGMALLGLAACRDILGD